MWRSVVSISGTQNLELPDLQVYRNAFPSDVCQALHLHILRQPNRKVVHYVTDPSYDVPEEISSALTCVPFLGYGNTVITKRYELTDESGAFGVHNDPKRFAQGPLVLCTLGGRAILSIISDDRRLTEIECVPNTAVIAHDNPMHIVTPPLDDEVRTFMFSGTDAGRPTWLSSWKTLFAARMDQ